MSLLLPCPFCGGKAYHIRTKVRSDSESLNLLHFDQIQCTGCAATTRAYLEDSCSAIAAWNKRNNQVGMEAREQ